MPKKRKSSKKPARVLVECSPHRTIGGGFLPDLMEYDAEHESHIERSGLATLALCHDVRSIASQATEEECSHADGPQHHTPDYTVDTFIPKLRIEVKALASLVEAASLTKYASIAQGYRARGIPLAFLVDAQLQIEPRIESVQLLFRYVSSRVPDGVLARATTVLAQGPLSVRQLKARASLETVDVWTLIARRHVCFDWAVALNDTTSMVSLPDQPFRGLRLEDILRSTRFAGLLEELALGHRPTDQCVLADAATWRQHGRPLGPFSFVGGFQDTEPLRDLDGNESIPRGIGRKRNHAPGASVVPMPRAN